MKIDKVRIKNYRSIKDSGDISFNSIFYVLAGQNESGKSSILEALNAYENEKMDRDTLNFELENDNQLIQSVQCTYSGMNDTFFQDIAGEIVGFLFDGVADEKKLDVSLVIDQSILKRLSFFSLTRSIDFNESSAKHQLQLDQNSFAIIKSAFLIDEVPIVKTDEEDEDDDEDDDKDNSNIATSKKIDFGEIAGKIAEIVWSYCPKIILFNDFTTLLPDKISLADFSKKQGEGYKAVENLQSLMGTDFVAISKKNVPQKNSTTEQESRTLSADFQKDWQQKIYGNNNVNIRFFIENNAKGEAEISFFIETKDQEYLAPRKRSKGMIWFISLWLELKSQEDNSSLVLLFDEPGLHLHIKACKDMLSVFHKLNLKNHQIIYSTHSPSLIETEYLHSIGLVLNHETKGTIVEGLTSAKINSPNKRDALQPISEAMGVEPLKDFSILKRKNVLVEGLSDFWYLKAMHKLLRAKDEYEFIPGIGIKENKINHLISFCVGYGLDWLLVMDGGELPKKSREQLKTHLFDGNEDETKDKIYMVEETDIENLFSVKDLNLIDPKLKLEDKRPPIEIIGDKRKVLFSRLFYSAIIDKRISQKDLASDTIKKFEQILLWIDQKFGQQSI